MRQTKLYKALINLSGHELNRLHRFILSPYFNRNEAVIRLFEWIKNDLKKIDDDASKEHLWKISFPDELYDNGRFRKLVSDLLALVQDFFAQEHFESNAIHKSRFLLEAIQEKELKELRSASIKYAKKQIQEQKIKSASFYYHQYEIYQINYEIESSLLERSSKLNIESIAENLDKFYLAEKLRYYCAILNHQNIAALDYKMLFIDEIINHVEAHGYEDVAAIQIYYQILQTYKSPDDRIHYDKLKQLISHHIHNFPEHQTKEIIDAALNYCVIRSNRGSPEFVRELFNLYKDLLANKLIFVRGRITPWTFKNIVTAGLRLNEFDWVKQFIDTYNILLEDKYRENAIRFNLAQFYFYKKEYTKVIQQLSQVEYEDITYNLNSKILLMASYFELDEFEALNSLLDTFRVYLSRNKELAKSRKKHYLNTIGIVRKLSKIDPGNTKEIERLKSEVDNTQGIVSKNWILEKLSTLKSEA